MLRPRHLLLVFLSVTLAAPAILAQGVSSSRPDRMASSDWSSIASESPTPTLATRPPGNPGPSSAARTTWGAASSPSAAAVQPVGFTSRVPVNTLEKADFNNTTNHYAGYEVVSTQQDVHDAMPTPTAEPPASANAPSPSQPSRMQSGPTPDAAFAKDCSGGVDATDSEWVNQDGPTWRERRLLRQQSRQSLFNETATDSASRSDRERETRSMLFWRDDPGRIGTMIRRLRRRRLTRILEGTEICQSNNISTAANNANCSRATGPCDSDTGCLSGQPYQKRDLLDSIGRTRRSGVQLAGAKSGCRCGSSCGCGKRSDDMSCACDRHEGTHTNCQCAGHGGCSDNTNTCHCSNACHGCRENGRDTTSRRLLARSRLRNAGRQDANSSTCENGHCRCGNRAGNGLACRDCGEGRLIQQIAKLRNRTGKARQANQGTDRTTVRCQGGGCGRGCCGGCGGACGCSGGGCSHGCGGGCSGSSPCLACRHGNGLGIISGCKSMCSNAIQPSGDQPGHQAYQSYGKYYYHRPYNAEHYRQHQNESGQMGSNTPNQAYTGDVFERAYDETLRQARRHDKRYLEYSSHHGDTWYEGHRRDPGSSEQFFPRKTPKDVLWDTSDGLLDEDSASDKSIKSPTESPNSGKGSGHATDRTKNDDSTKIKPRAERTMPPSPTRLSPSDSSDRAAIGNLINELLPKE